MNFFRCSLIVDGVQHNGSFYNQPGLFHSNSLSQDRGPSGYDYKNTPKNG